MPDTPEQLPDDKMRDKMRDELIDQINPLGVTPKGLPYPPPTDPVAGGAAAIQALANAVDAKLYPWSFRTGYIASNGAAYSGTGWTVAHPSAGIYQITFTPAFSVFPIIVCQNNDAGGSRYFGPDITASSPSGFSVNCQIFGGGGVDMNWSFIAVAVA